MAAAVSSPLPAQSSERLSFSSSSASSSVRSSDLTPGNSLFHVPDGPVGFAFDIDGVLVRGGRVLESARRALAALYDPSGSRALHPLVFLTNGGGVTEEARAKSLSAKFGVEVSARQVVQSHTPMRRLVELYGDQPILALGRGATADLAASYGFSRALTAEDLRALSPGALPFSGAGPLAGETARGRRPGSARRAREVLGEGGPIRAVLVFNDPSDWYAALQLTLDVVFGRGVPWAYRSGAKGLETVQGASTGDLQALATAAFQGDVGGGGVDEGVKRGHPGAKGLPGVGADGARTHQHPHPRPVGGGAGAGKAPKRPGVLGHVPKTDRKAEPSTGDGAGSNTTPSVSSTAPSSPSTLSPPPPLSPLASPPPVIFSHRDAVWVADYPAPRLAQGMLLTCLKAVHAALTAADQPPLVIEHFGKPYAAAYEAAEESLLAQAKDLGMPLEGGVRERPEEEDEAGAGRPAPPKRPLCPSPRTVAAFASIYAIGDNPAADVAGAAARGRPWTPVLVRTGVFDDPDAANDPTFPADLVVDDVEAAVKAALNRTRAARWHRYR